MTLAPRVVVIHRRTELEELLDRHGTRGQAEFFLHRRGRDLAAVQARHDAVGAALQTVSGAMPVGWRRGTVERGDLDRFLFDPADIVVAVGQDGLVANVAKYLHGQPVIGVDPEPGRGPAVLVPHAAADVAQLLAAVAVGAAPVVARTMAAAVCDDGQELVALNEIFLGHPSHQSARYLIRTPQGRSEQQSSSGLVAGTGTGATGGVPRCTRTTTTLRHCPGPRTGGWPGSCARPGRRRPPGPPARRGPWMREHRSRWWWPRMRWCSSVTGWRPTGSP